MPLHKFALVLAAFLPYAAFAQQTKESSEPSAEVIVTAQKRESSVQDVPFSVGVQTEEQIRQSGANNIVELSRNVVGLAIADLGPGQSQVAIRGISAGQVIRDQPGVKEQVGIYLDESPISVALFTPDLDLFDLDRFEVLRGPQGTLFGSGSTAGTLRYITTQPKLGKFEGSAELGFSGISGGDTGGDVKGAVNLPIGDKAALRVVGYYDRLAGFVDALQPNGSVKEDVNTGKKTGGRVALLFEPIENLKVAPRVVYQKLTTDGYPRADIWNILGDPTTNQPKDNFGDFQQFTQHREGIDDKFTLTDLKLDYDFGPVSLTSISSYTDRKVVVLRDASQLTGSITIDFGGTAADARLTSPLFDTTKLKVFSQEVRVASNGNSAFDWLVGGFYQDIDRHYGQSLPTPGYDAFLASVGSPDNPFFGAPVDDPFFSNLTYKLKQYAAFGEGTYHITDQWSLTGGLRYYDFKEDRVLIFAGAFVGVPGGTPPDPGKTDSNGFSPRGILTYRLNDDMQFNLQVARGFRLGGINDPINVPLCSAEDLAVFGNQGTWKDETNTNYEIGAKMLLADRRVTFNISAFHSDIKDLQATTTAGTCSSRIVFNVPKARSDGVEAELFARLNSNWDFGLSGTYIDAALRSSVTSTDNNGNTVVVGGLAKGNRLPTAPRFQSAASLGYTMPVMGGGKNFFSNLTWQHVGSSFSQFENEISDFGLIGGADGARLITLAPTTTTSFAFNAQLPEYDIANLRVGLKTDVWETAVFVNNLTDERALLALDYERGRSARVGYLVNQPRTYGITLTRSF